MKSYLAFVFSVFVLPLAADASILYLNQAQITDFNEIVSEPTGAACKGFKYEITLELKTSSGLELTNTQCRTSDYHFFGDSVYRVLTGPKYENCLAEEIIYPDGTIKKTYGTREVFSTLVVIYDDETLKMRDVSHKSQKNKCATN